MQSLKSRNPYKRTFLFFILILFSIEMTNAQDYRFGIYVTPAITWFSTDVSVIRNKGARAGLNIGANIERYFNSNFALTGGINIMNAGGRLISNDLTSFNFPDYTTDVAPNNPVVYKIQYLVFPLGIRAKANKIGYLTLFSDIGLDPKIVVRGRVDIPSKDIKGENGIYEIRRFNLGYHIHTGIGYPIGGTSFLDLGLGFESNFLDITKDIGDQINDRVSHKFLKFIFGVNF